MGAQQSTQPLTKDTALSNGSPAPSTPGSKLSTPTTIGGPPIVSKRMLLTKVAGFASKDQIDAALEATADDEDLAMEVLRSKAPILKDDPEGWFNFFDSDKSGTIEKEELIEALKVALKDTEAPYGYIEALVTNWFPSFDKDGSGHWDMEEFMQAQAAILVEMGVWHKDAEDHEDHKKHTLLNEAVDFLKNSLLLVPDGGVLVVYFCASLDLPGASFTSILDERCSKYKKADKLFEVAVVPLDSTEALFQENSKQWPTEWLRLGNFKKDRATWQFLAKVLDVQSVPSVIILDKKSHVVTRRGVEKVKADSEGSFFPWAESQDLMPVDNPTASLGMAKLKKHIKFKVDDEALGEEASKVTLTKESYLSVAKSASNVAMRVFIKRIIKTKGWYVSPHDSRLGDLVWEHSGIRLTQTLAKLIEDLKEAEWVHKDPDGCWQEAERKRSGHLREAEAERVVIEGLQNPDEAEDAAPDPQPAAPEAAGKAKGKGKPPGPPGPPAAAASEEAAQLKAMPPAEGKGKGPPGPAAQEPADSSDASPAVKIKGKGKGKVKGLIPGPPAKGKGKEKKEPTRTEKEDWVTREKPKVLWKRHLHGREVESSLFSHTVPGQNVPGEAPINMEEFVDKFGPTRIPKKGEEVQEAKVVEVKVQKKAIWDDVKDAQGNVIKNKDAETRTKALTILAQASFKKEPAALLIERLETLSFEAVINDPKFDAGALERLRDYVSDFTANDIEHLQNANSPTLFSWHDNYEGFYARLIAVSQVKDRLSWIIGHVTCESLVKELLERAEPISQGLHAVYNSSVLVLLCEKMLTLGNCLNAGTDTGRADGYDAIQALYKVLLRGVPKGKDKTLSLMEFIKMVELNDDERQEFRDLAHQLSEWKVPKDNNDHADLAVLSNESQVLSRDIGDREKSLQDEQRAEDKAEQAAWMEKCLKEHRKASSEIDTKIATLKDLLKHVREYFIYKPDIGVSKLAAGFILGVVSELAAKMGEETQSRGHHPPIASRRGAASRASAYER